MTEIEIRLLQEDDIDSINQLYKKSYGVERSKEKLIWEFIKGPAGPAIYVVASKDNTIIGTQCAIPLYLKSPEGKLILTAKSEDTLVDSAFRGQAIFEKMYDLLFKECRIAGIQYLWGFTYAAKPFKKLQFDVPFNSNFGLSVSNPIASYKLLVSLKKDRKIIENIKIGALVIISFAYSKSKLIFRGDLNHNLISTRPLKEINDSRNSSIYYQLSQDESFINWRITDNPYNQHLHYSLLSATGSVIGNAICSLHITNVAYVMHLTFNVTVKKSTKVSFIKALIKYLHKRVAIVRFWGFENTLEGREELVLLKRSGFIFVGTGISFVWKDITETQTINLNPMEFKLSRLCAQSSS